MTYWATLSQRHTMLSFDKRSTMLSEETEDLTSSFDSESDASFERTPNEHQSFHRFRNNTNNEDSLYRSPESFLFTNKLTQCNEMDCFDLDNVQSPTPKHNCSDVLSAFNTPENTSHSMGKMLDCLSLDDRQFHLTSKIKELKSISSEANDAYINFLISQFFMDSYKAAKHNVNPEIAKKVDKAVTCSAMDKLSILKSKKGERYNLLGLEEEQIRIAPKGNLSSIEKAVLSKQAVAVLESNVEHLSSQRMTLKGLFATYCQKVVKPDSLLCEETERLADLHNCVQNQLDQACQLLTSTNQLMQQLARTLQTSEKGLAVASYTSLRDKATYLQQTTCVLRLKVEERLYRDKQLTKAMNTLGNELKTSVDALGMELKSLQKTLAEYEKKEEASRQYKELVTEYAKTKRQLNHKYQTLNVLNDPDVSFT